MASGLGHAGDRHGNGYRRVIGRGNWQEFVHSTYSAEFAAPFVPSDSR